MSEKIYRVVNSLLLFVLLALSVYINFTLRVYRILAFNNINNYLLIANLIVLLVFLLLIVFNKLKIFNMITMIVLIGLFSFMSYYLNGLVSSYSKIESKSQEVKEFGIGIAVLKDSGIEKLGDIGENPVLEAASESKELVDGLKKDISEKTGNKLNFKPVENYIKAYEKLIDGDCKAIVINDKSQVLLAAEHPEYNEKIKLIYTYKFTKKVEKKENVEKDKLKKAKKESILNIYVSGIDTYGSLSTVSRSDVNVLVTVNMDTHKILLTNTPRDSYVKIPGQGNNEYDKLTHAGLYGVDISKNVLENLYGISIDHYVRVNFTTFLRVIDIIGGIDVDNDQAFESSLNGNFYPQGNIHLDSNSALAFARERYGLSGGDNDRGKNHLKVITAVIKKLTTKESLLNFSNIVDSLSDSVETNMPLDVLMKLANKQLQSGVDFEINQQALQGTGSMSNPSYAMPGYELYTLEISPDSLKQVKEEIYKLMEE